MKKIKPIIEDIIEYIPMIIENCELDNLNVDYQIIHAFDKYRKDQWRIYCNQNNLEEKLLLSYIKNNIIPKEYNLKDKNKAIAPWYAKPFIDTIETIKNSNFISGNMELKEYIRQFFRLIHIIENTWLLNADDAFLLFIAYAHTRTYGWMKEKDRKKKINVWPRDFNLCEKQLSVIKSNKFLIEYFPDNYKDIIYKIIDKLKYLKFISIYTHFKKICKKCVQGYSPNIIEFYESLTVIDYEWEKFFKLLKSIKEYDETDFTINVKEFHTVNNETGHYYYGILDYESSRINEPDSLILTPEFKYVFKGCKVIFEVFDYQNISDDKLEICLEIFKKLKECKPTHRKHGELSGRQRYLKGRNKYIRERYDYYKKTIGLQAEKSFDRVNDDLIKKYKHGLSIEQLRRIIYMKLWQ